MAPSEAATPADATKTTRTAPSQPPDTSANKNLVTRDYDLVFRAFFPTPSPPAKFHPIPAMNQLIRQLLKDEPSLVLRTPANDKQIILASASLPSGEAEFKKYFKVTPVRIEKQNKTQVCIGCHVLSNRSLGSIKFRSTDGNLLAWLKKEHIFLESDGLGIDRPVTTGYFLKIAPSLTHLANFRVHLENQLMLVDIDADTAVELAPHLKQARLEAMSSGDDFIPILPEFEVYRTRLSHGRENSQVSTEVLGIKCAPKDAKLLGEFLTRMASATSNEQRDGIYLPKGAAYLLGMQTYAQALQDNNSFLNSVATIPINLPYDAWFAVINPNQTSETEPISIHDHLISKNWFLRIESVAPNKCLLVTTKNHLAEARNWIDANLESFIRQSIPDGIDPPTSQLPRRLDKPVYSAASHTYADILKKKIPLAATPNAPTTVNNRPPRKRQATMIDYDSDGSTASTALTAVPNLSNQNAAPSTPTSQAPSPDYAAELSSMKAEILSLRTIISEAVEQFKSAIASFPTPSPASSHAAMSSDMETDADQHNEVEPPTVTTTDLSDLIAGLKNDIATKLDISTLIIELKSDIAVIKSHPLFCHLKPPNQHIPVT